MLSKLKKILVTITLLLLPQAVLADNLCSCECNFDNFFRENYQNLLAYLCPNEERRKIFDILFNAYSIKFKGLDYEYENICAQIEQDKDGCIAEKKKYVKSLSMIAIDEYDSFLDDLSFELCEDENLENPIIKKNKKKYRKNLKKLISKHCK